MTVLKFDFLGPTALLRPEFAPRFLFEAGDELARQLVEDGTCPTSSEARRAKRIGRWYAYPHVREVDRQHLQDVGKILGESQPPATATLYRTLVPQRVRLIRKNTLCGAKEDARWILVVRSAEDLGLAVFSGESEPDLDYAAVSQSHSFCGTFFYVRQGK